MPAKEETVRDYRERINRVIFHVESHLGEPMGLQDLARIACFSTFHFHLMVSPMGASQHGADADHKACS
jgi:AraC family transcriptional regulator